MEFGVLLLIPLPVASLPPNGPFVSVLPIPPPSQPHPLCT